MDVEPVVTRTERMADCLRRARAGDLTAIKDIVAELTPLLWHVARAQGLTAEDAEDAVQTAWLELVRQLDKIEEPTALTGWLVTTTKREAWHINARRRRQAGPGTEFLADLPDGAPGPDERLAADEDHRALHRHLLALSAKCRELLRIVAQVDRPDYAVIGAALGMPHGSIGPTRGRCLAKLRALLLDDPAWSSR